MHIAEQPCLIFPGPEVVMSGTIVTPHADGRVDFPEGDAVFGASAYFDGKLWQGRVRWLPDIWGDRDRGMRVARDSADAAATLTQRILMEIDGTVDDARVPLILDIAINFVELALERMLRLATAGWEPKATRLMPPSAAYRLKRIRLGHEYHTSYSKQPLQWLMLRLLALGEDQVEWIDDPWRARVRDSLARRHSWQRLMRQTNSSPALYGGQLGAFGPFIRGMGIPVLKVPDLVQPYSWRRNKALRSRLADVIGDVLSPLFTKYNVSVAGLPKLTALLSDMIPVTRIECRDKNIARYRRWFDDQPVAGFITATGMAFYDENVFFISECRRRNIPSVVIQHGGQYGYDARIPTYFSRDMCTPSHFVSWGWSEFPGGYRSNLATAKIVPLPNPVLSELRMRRAGRHLLNEPRTLLVPLSKLRTMDPRVGGNATDGSLPQMRRFVIEVLDTVKEEFSRVIVTYRSRNFFETDPLYHWAARVNHPGLSMVSFRDAPVRDWLGKVHAVLWDTAATGFLETLTYGVPTVVLLQRQRWAAEASWAESSLASSGIAVYDAPAGINSLRRFMTEPSAWAAAQNAAIPVLDSYGRSADNYKEQWQEFLKQITGRPDRPGRHDMVRP